MLPPPSSPERVLSEVRQYDKLSDAWLPYRATPVQALVDRLRNGAIVGVDEIDYLEGLIVYLAHESRRHIRWAAARRSKKSKSAVPRVLNSDGLPRGRGKSLTGEEVRERRKTLRKAWAAFQTALMEFVNIPGVLALEPDLFADLLGLAPPLAMDMEFIERVRGWGSHEWIAQGLRAKLTAAVYVATGHWYDREVGAVVVTWARELDSGNGEPPDPKHEQEKWRRRHQSLVKQFVKELRKDRGNARRRRRRLGTEPAHSLRSAQDTQEWQIRALIRVLKRVIQRKWKVLSLIRLLTQESQRRSRLPLGLGPEALKVP
jgi:hypothetical protein